MYHFLANLYTSVLDRYFVVVNNGLQHIEDPRLRFATLAYLFVKTARSLGLSPQRVIEYVERGLADAERQDTAEMRGTGDYIKQEYGL